MPHDFQALLEQLCTRLRVPAGDIAEILRTGALMIGDAPFTLHADEWSGFVKVYVDAGCPAAPDAAAIHHYLLTQQLLQPAPFFISAGVHAETGHIFFYGYSPMPVTEEEDQGFFGFLEGCAVMREEFLAQFAAVPFQ